MKITMIDLYDKIYEEEQPYHIRVYGEDWYWNNYDGYVTKESLKTTPDAQIYLMDRYRTFMNLDKDVEVIEEEKKIPEKLSTWFSLEKDCENDNIQYANNNFKTMYEKINSIIDYLKSKGDE